MKKLIKKLYIEIVARLIVFIMVFSFEVGFIYLLQCLHNYIIGI